MTRCDLLISGLTSTYKMCLIMADIRHEKCAPPPNIILKCRIDDNLGMASPEKQILESAEGSAEDPAGCRPGGENPCRARERKRARSAREGEAQRGETREGGGRTAEAGAVAEGAVRRGPEDDPLRVLQGWPLREGEQV